MATPEEELIAPGSQSTATTVNREPVSSDVLLNNSIQVIKNATDIETGYRQLTKEYQAKAWDDPQKAKEILTQSGTLLRQKFNKNNIASLEDPNADLYYSKEELPDANIEDPIARQVEKENLWEQANLERLKIADDPQTLLKKDLLVKYVPTAASLQRRKLEDPGFVQDAAARVALGVISPVTSLFGAENPQFLTESTSPERDDDFLSELFSGVGTVGAAVGLTATTGIGGLAYLGAGALGSVRETFEETKEQSGSTERALAAASIDAVGQGVGFYLGGKVAGKIGAKFGQSMTAANDILAKGGTQEAAKETFQKVMGMTIEEAAVAAEAEAAKRVGRSTTQKVAETGLQQAGANLAMGQGARSSQRFGASGDVGDVVPTSEDIIPAAQNALVGGVLGSVGYGLHAQLESTRQRGAERRAIRAAEEVRKARETVSEAPTDIVETVLQDDVRTEKPQVGQQPNETKEQFLDRAMREQEARAAEELPLNQEREKARLVAKEEPTGYPQGSPGDIFTLQRREYDAAVARGDKEWADFLLGVATRVAENKPINEPPEYSELANPEALAEKAYEAQAKENPTADEFGVAQARQERKPPRTPASEIQQEPVGETASFAHAKNGDTYRTYKSGKTQQVKTSAGPLAMADAVVSIKPEIAAKIQSLTLIETPDGQSPKVYWDNGQPFIKSKYVTRDLDISDVPTGDSVVPIPFTPELAVGDHPLSVSTPIRNGERTQYHWNIGSAIERIQTGPGAPVPPGTTGPEGTPGTEKLTLAQRVVDNPNLPQWIRDAFMTIDAKGKRVTTLEYFPESHVVTGNSGLEWIAQMGGDPEAYSVYMSGPNVVPLDVQAGAQELFGRLAKASLNAAKAGDIISTVKLHDLATALEVKLANTAKELGQGVSYFNTFKHLNPEEATAYRVNEVRSGLIKEQLAKEGITPDQAALEPAQVAAAKERIKQIKENPEGAKLSKAQEGKLAKAMKETGETKEPERSLSQRQEDMIAEATKEYKAIEEKIERRSRAAEKELNSKFPPEVRKRYEDLLRAREEFPDKSVDRKAVDTLLNRINLDLSRSFGEQVMAGWRSYYILNLLADVGTGAATAVGNMANLGVGSTAAVFGGAFRGGKVSDIPQNFEQFARIASQSLPKALRNAFADFRGNYFQKYGEGDFLETGFGTTQGLTGAKKMAIETANLLKPLGYVGRFLSALDTFSSELGTDAVTAIRLMELNPEIRNLRSDKLVEALDRALYGTETFRDQVKIEALARAKKLEALGIKADPRVIADEMYRRQRPENIQEEIEKWGQKVALRGKPNGAIGQFGEGLSKLRQIPFAGPAFINFVNASGNLIALKLELTPYGFLRPTLLEAGGTKLTPLEKSQMYTSAILGSVVAAGAYTLMQQGVLQIHGAGPSNQAEKDNLKTIKWKPFSFQVGNHFVSYAEMPFATILAGVGGYSDYLKYSAAKNKIGEKEAANYIMAAGFSSLFANPLQQNAADLIDILKQGNEGGDIAGRLGRFATRTVGEAARNAIIPGNRTLRNIAAMWQDPLETRLSLQAAVLNGLPWVGSVSAGAGKPALNLFGEPIMMGTSAFERYRSISRFYTQQVSDPALRFLTDKGYYITDLPGKVTIPDENYGALKERRKEMLSADFEDIMTQSERYELQAKSGREIKGLVEEYRFAYGDSAWNEKIQKKLSQDVSEIRSKWKRRILFDGISED